MRPETELIWKLVGKLIDEAGSQLTADTTEGKVPRAIANRLKQYEAKGFAGPLWINADHDILVMIAMSDLMWENRIRPLANKDEDDLQAELGVSALSRAATTVALTRMRDESKNLKVLQTQCETLPTIALAVVAKSAMAGPANASQVAFDKMGADQVRKNCDRNKQHVTAILQKLQRVIPVTEQTLRVHDRQ